MDAMQKLLDKAREKCSPSNDAALARRLRVTSAAVANYRTGTSLPAASVTERIAQLAGEDPATWVLMVEAVRAGKRSGEDAATWSRIAKRLAAAVGVLMLAVVAAPQQSIAQPGIDASHNATGLYIMRNARRFMARLVSRWSRVRIAAWTYRRPAVPMVA